jgi:hypothetical protein
MAEETTKKKLSPETEAIIDRLKREGQLTRNSEGNSIKSIKINLDKFADAFTAIQKSSEDTARIMTENFVDGNTEILKKVDESLEGLTDEQKKAELQRRKEVKEEAIKKKEETREQSMAEKSLRATLMNGFGDLKKGFLAVKKDPWGSLLQIGKWAVIIPVLAGAIKGLLDVIFGDSEMAKFYDTINNSAFMKFVKNHPWASLGVALTAFAGVKWMQMYLAMMAAAKTLGVGGGTDVVAGGTGKGKGKGLKDRLGRLLKTTKGKGGLAGIVLLTVGGITYAVMDDDDEPVNVDEEIKRIRRENEVKEQEVIKGKIDSYKTTLERDRTTFGDVLTGTLVSGGIGAAGGAAVGGVGAIPGLIGGLIFGAVTGLGTVAYEAVDDYRNDIDNIPNELEALLKKEKFNMADKTGRNRQFQLSDKQKEDLVNANDALIQKMIDGLVGTIAGQDVDLKNLEAALGGEVTRQRKGSSRVFSDYVTMPDGTLIKKSEAEKQLADLKEERLLREQQLITSRNILKARKGEEQAIQENVQAVEDNTTTVNEKTVEIKDTPKEEVDIKPSTEERERKQNIAAGGFALNITNNYYNKGGDTVVQNQSDNRVASTKNTAIRADGGGGGSRFGGSLPSGGAMA